MKLTIRKPYCKNSIIYKSKDLDKIKSFLIKHNTKEWMINRVLKLKKKSIKIKITRSKEGDIISY